MSCGIGDQVDEHLHYARPVGHDPGDVRLDDYVQVVSSAAAQKGGPCLVQQHRYADVGSGATDRLPVSMRATSRRSEISSRMASACVRMIWRNWLISVGRRECAPSIRVVTEPLMEVSGVRSSWLTMARNSRSEALHLV